LLVREDEFQKQIEFKEIFYETFEGKFPKKHENSMEKFFCQKDFYLIKSFVEKIPFFHLFILNFTKKCSFSVN
jgi:hypothetical protein